MHTIAEVMTPDPACLYVEDPLEDAWKLMRTRRIRHIPVTKRDGKLVGLITHRDLLTNAHDTRYLSLPIAEIMDTDLVTIDINDDLKDAISKLRDKKIGCLPVMKEGELAGIITSGDLLSLTYLLLAEAT